jgi:soluble lytic murein transglycosylase-like protein
VTRQASRWLWKRPLWQKALVAALAPLCCLNLAVAFCGSSLVVPVSPFFLAEKAIALGRYATHRPGCLLRGHPALEPLIAQAAGRHALPAGLFEAVVQVESKGNPHRISAAGAMGPAQLTAATADRLSVKDPFEPAQALDAGARYLAALLKRFSGDPRLALAAYNAGPGAIHGGEIPRNGETEIYVQKVMLEYERRRPVRRGPGALASARPAQKSNL